MTSHPSPKTSVSSCCDDEYTRIGLLLILGLAAALRLWAFDLMEFKYDEVTAIRLARDWLETGIPRYGMMSGVGIRNPPGFMFILAPIVALTSHPLWICLWITLANLAAVWVLYRAAAAMQRPVAGLWAAGFMAVHPWLILYSRKIWAQSLLPPLVSLLLLILLRGSCRDRSRAVFWLAPLTVLLPMIHLSGICVIPVVAAWAAAQSLRGRLHRPLLLLGILPALLLAWPYIGYLAASGQADMAAARGAGGAVSFASVADTLQTWAATAFADGFGYPFTWQPAPMTQVIPGVAGYLLDIGAGCATALVWIAVLAAVMPLPRAGRPHACVIWPGMLAALPPVVYAARGIVTPPHYFVIGLPALLLLAGMGLERLRRAFRLVPLLGAAACLAACAVWAVVLSRIQADGGSAGDYGTAFRHQAAAAHYLAERGLTQRQVDATLTRDRGIGMLYLMNRLPEPNRGPAAAHAQVVNQLLFREHAGLGGPPPAPSLRTGPLAVYLTTPEESP